MHAYSLLELCDILCDHGRLVFSSSNTHERAIKGKDNGLNMLCYYGRLVFISDNTDEEVH